MIKSLGAAVSKCACARPRWWATC